jgi:hypothetical protein
MTHTVYKTCPTNFGATAFHTAAIDFPFEKENTSAMVYEKELVP